MRSTLKLKLLGASLLVLLLAVWAQQTGVGAAVLARALLGLAAAAGLGVWMIRARKTGGARPFHLPPRLSIAARTGLSARTGLALVEADGRRFLVAYGDGFAQLLDAVPAAAPAQARAGRRPSTRRSSRKAVRP